MMTAELRTIQIGMIVAADSFVFWGLGIAADTGDGKGEESTSESSIENDSLTSRRPFEDMIDR